MKTIPLAQPPPTIAKPAAQTASTGTATKAAAVGAPTAVARPPPAPPEKGGGDWLDSRLPTGTAAFQAQLIGQTSLSGQVETVNTAERSRQLAAYPQLRAQSSKAGIDVYEPIDVDKPRGLDLYI